MDDGNRRSQQETVWSRFTHTHTQYNQGLIRKCANHYLSVFKNKTSTQGTDLLGKRSVHRAALSERKPTQKTKTKTEPNPNRKKARDARTTIVPSKRKENKRKRFKAPIYIPRRFNYWVMASRFL
jgi:hypothetical protein